MRLLRLAGLCGVLAAFNGLAAPLDIVHFDNGDRLTGTIAEQNAESVTIDVDRIGTIVVPRSRIARLVRLGSEDEANVPPERVADATEVEATPPPRLADWDLVADLGLVVARGNTRTEDYNLVLGAERTGRRFDNVAGFAVRRASARLGVDGPVSETKDQLDLSYDLRWKFAADRAGGDRWYAVASFDYFRDPIKNIERRMTGGLGMGHTLWDSPRGALATDLGVSQVYETLQQSLATAEDPALRWGLTFKRWLLPEWLEVFHNHQLLRKLGATSGAVWDSDTGIRLHLNDRWRAGVRIDLQHESHPAPGRQKTDASYAIALGAAL